jgi:hypothetical protein
MERDRSQTYCAKVRSGIRDYWLVIWYDESWQGWHMWHERDDPNTVRTSVGIQYDQWQANVSVIPHRACANCEGIIYAINADYLCHSCRLDCSYCS